MEGIVLTDGDVIILNNEYLPKYPKLHSRLKELSSNCEDEYDKCGKVYKDIPCPLSYTVIKLGRDLNPDKELDAQSSFVMGYLIVVADEKLNEIWGICSVEHDEYEKILSRLLEVVIQNNGGKPLYISLDKDNSLWDSLLKLYVSQDFHSPTISNVTPLGFPIKTGSIWLLWDGEKVEEEETIISAGNIKVFLNKCTLSYELTPKVSKRLFKSTAEDVETAGSLYVSKWKGNTAILALDKDKIVKGDGEPQYKVKIPHTHLTFHSHPSLCDNNTWRCYITWPSVDDMLYLIKSYLRVKDSTYMHLVVVDKGIYFLSVSYPFQLLLNKLERDVIDTLTASIRKILETTMEENGVKSDNPLFYDSLNTELEEIVQKKISTLSFSEVLEGVDEETKSKFKDEEGDMADNDYSIFESTFVRRAKFDREGVLMHRVDYYGKCPIEETIIPQSNLIV